MRYPEDKLKQAILHPDLDVRDAAIEYFYGPMAPDDTLMPLAIEAIERFGRMEAFSFTHHLNRLSQTEQTIAWVIAELQRDVQGTPEEKYFYWLNLSRLLCHADVRLVGPRAEEILWAPHFEPKERQAFGERIEMAQWGAHADWQALQQYCQSNKDKDSIEDFDWGQGLRIVEALARKAPLDQEKIVAILSEKVRDYRQDARRWLQPLAATLAGETRLKAAVPLLAGYLGDPHNGLLSYQSLYGLIKIGGEEALSAVCVLYPSASIDFRHFASELLGKVHLDLAIDRVLQLLAGEADPELRIKLCGALLDQFSQEGVEPARQLVKQHAPTPELCRLRSSLISACKVMEIQFPEFDQWQELARKDALETRARSQEINKIIYDARGDLSFLVQRMKAMQAEKQSALTGRSQPRHPRLSRRPVLGQDRPAGGSSSHKSKVGRNDACPCGSGRKYKHCCLRS